MYLLVLKKILLIEFKSLFLHVKTLEESRVFCLGGHYLRMYLKAVSVSAEAVLPVLALISNGMGSLNVLKIYQICISLLI